MKTHLVLVCNVNILAARHQRVRLSHAKMLSGDREIEAESLCSRVISKISKVLQQRWGSRVVRSSNE